MGRASSARSRRTLPRGSDRFSRTHGGPRTVRKTVPGLRGADRADCLRGGQGQTPAPSFPSDNGPESPPGRNPRAAVRGCRLWGFNRAAARAGDALAGVDGVGSKGTSHPSDEIVGRMRPTSFREFWEYTVEKVAVNAVMAGARPEYFPVILALAASGSTAKSSSTTSMTNMAVVNGPVRNEIGMNSGIGALGPYNHANVTIGRAYALLSQNLQGGSVPGETYMGTLGNGLAYSACFAENEEKSPWEPLHVEKGIAAGESAVSVFFGLRYVQEGYGPRETWQEKMRRCLSSGAHFPPLLVMDPIVARLFVERGMTTKERLIDWCAANARLPAREYWDDQWVQTLLRPLAVAGVEPYASRLKAAPDDIVQMFEPKEINLVVAGGGAQGAWKMFGARYERTISIDAWR